jgi:hypothetical protein
LPRTASTLLQEAIFEPAPGLTYVGRPHTQTGAAFNRLQYADDSLFDPTELSRAFETIRHGAGGRPIVISDELLSGFPFPNARVALEERRGDWQGPRTGFASGPSRTRSSSSTRYSSPA